MDNFDELSKAVLVGGIVAAGLGVKKIASWTKSYLTTQYYNGVREKKKAELHVANTKWTDQMKGQIKEEDATRIVNLSFEDLLKALHAGEISATKALHAYQYKAVKENANCNFVCEPIVEAEDMASKLDALSSEERRNLPLCGIPISLKENYMLEGYDCTVGCVRLINKPMKETSSIVKMLTAQGAVPFIRTNIPQTCMSFDSINPIYGTTTNPHNPGRSCGGSSGGEGAAVGSGSSVLGFGSDIGGSVRIPAAFCGIYSLKPTSGRLSFHGDTGVDLNERIVTVTCGPMGRDVNSLIAAMRILSMPESYSVDPYVPPISFNEEMLNSTRKLRIGYFYKVPLIEVCESSRRAVDTAIQALRGAGHEVVSWTPPDSIWALTEAFVTNIFGDGGETFAASVDNDIWEDHIKETLYLCKAPVWLKKVLAYTIMPLFFPSYMCNYLISSCGSQSIANFWRDEADIKEYRRKVVQELKQQGIDAIICPAMPVPAMRIGECKDATGVVALMILYNLLNFPSGIVPITKVTTEDVQQDMKDFPVKDMWHKAMKSNIQDSEGLPVTIQCASLPFHEERCLRLMKELEGLIGYNVLDEHKASLKTDRN